MADGDGRLVGASLGRKPRGRHPDKRLTALMVRRAKPGWHADGGGLYLVVDESGAKRWMLRTVVKGRRRDIGLGGAGDVSLAEAREAAARLRKIARAGGDPIAERDRDKRRSLTFAEAAKLVHEEHVAKTARNGKHVQQWLRTLEQHAFPVIGKRPVHDIEQADVLRVLSPIWTEVPETARRVRQRMRTVFDWARAAGHRDAANPVEAVEKGLARQREKQQHFEALPWADLPGLWTRLERVNGMGALALRFAILTAARSGEVRKATWSEIDLDARTWTRPPEHMKHGQEHRVPLSEGAIAILRQVRPLRARTDSLVFPSRKNQALLSDMTLSAVLKRLGVGATVHGFRSTFRDWTEEATEFPHEVKESARARRPQQDRTRLSADGLFREEAGAHGSVGRVCAWRARRVVNRP